MPIKKLRIMLTYFVALLFFITSQLVDSCDTNRPYTILEAFSMCLIFLGIFYSAFSDWFYYDLEVKIDYNIFQHIGLFTVTLFMSMIISATYNGIYDTDIGIFSVGFYLLFGSIYVTMLLIVFFGNK